MLKIKDNVDLELLKEYGFSLTIKKRQLLYVYLNKYSINVIEIDIKTREIVNLGDRNGNIILYDLIKADLVEKVD
jgi:hypothetical protein